MTKTYTSPDAPGEFLPAGEKRAPKKGEFYLSGAIVEAYRAPNDLTTEYHIAIPKRPALTVHELADKVIAAGHDSHFFDRDTLRFFGDTMQNYGVRTRTAYVHGYDGTSTECYVLYRRKPVKHGKQDDAYFNVETFARVMSPR